MSISDPTQLIEEFKKSGEFDRLRRELLSQFKTNDTIGVFMSRVQDIVQQRLAEDERLPYLPPEVAHSELMQDMDRFPLVQRAVADLPALTDPSLSMALRRSLTRILSEGRGKQTNDKHKDVDGDIRMDDSDDSESEFSEDNEEEHERSSDDEEVVGKRKLVNGVKEPTSDDRSPSSSPLSRTRARFNS